MITQKIKNGVLVLSLIAGLTGAASARPFNPESLLDGSTVTQGLSVASHMFVETLIKTLEAAEELNTEELILKDEPLEILVALNDSSNFRFVLPSATKLPGFIKVAKRLVMVSEELTKAVNTHTLNLHSDIKQIIGEETLEEIISLIATKKESTETTPQAESVDVQTEPIVEGV